jgi:O-Antigen ligase
LAHQYIGAKSAFQFGQGARTKVSSFTGYEFYLKLLVLALFLPEGLSFFIGDFRLSLERVLLIILIPLAVSHFYQRSPRHSIRVPSDVFALAAGVWMLVAAIVTGGFAGLKGAGILVIEFSGAYYVFRYLLTSDGSVRVTKFTCKLVVLVVGIALLDPLTDKLYTYEIIKGLTGYVKPVYEAALAAQGETLFRNGVIRAMGPLEHSILFGAVCAWFGTLAYFTFPTRFFGWSVAAMALLGIWVSQARGPLLGFMIAFALAVFYVAAKGFAGRWKVLGLLATVAILAIFFFSGSPIATLMRLSGIGPEAAWYRQAIWDTAVPVVVRSPIFGIGLTDEWDWQSNSALVGTSVDAFWLRAAMMYGIPGALLILLTMTGAFWLGPLERSPFLSAEERRLSIALGLVTTTAVFLGFTVHFWGTCWVLLGIFPAMRANLAEAAIVRQQAASKFEAKRR